MHSGFRALTGLFEFTLMLTRGKKPVESRAFGLSGKPRRASYVRRMSNVKFDTFENVRIKFYVRKHTQSAEDTTHRFCDMSGEHRMVSVAPVQLCKMLLNDHS